jgi:hypothetical protein
MATTTNFGWETPDDTDLVKDGAAAMRTLGNSIDTSFVDLKGGTTNQVLAKNSNTDLDFKWVADATGIPATIIDAKGDLIAGTAADTAGRLAVGTNNYVLTADSAETTGMKWAAIPASTPAFTGVALTNSAVQTLSNSTNTAITFDTETFDTNAYHSTVTNTSRITIPVGYAGYYRITGAVAYASNATGLRSAKVYKNGTSIFHYSVTAVATGNPASTAVSFIANLAEGDYLELYAFQNSGGNLDTVNASAGQMTYFQAERVGV